MNKQTNKQGIEVRSFGNGAKPQVQQGSRLIEVFTERAQARHNARTPQQIADIQKRWDERRELLKAYHAHPADEWEHTAIYPKAGGYVVTSKERIKHSLTSKKETQKLQKELHMCEVFAKNGYQIELLNEVARVSSPDVRINGINADLKSTKGHKNIVKYAKKAVRKQGAKIVLFEFEEFGSEHINELKKLKEEGIKALFYVKREDKVRKL